MNRISQSDRPFGTRNLGLAVLTLALIASTAIAAPSPRGMSAVPYISGGVGDEELRAIQSVSPDYNLKLIMSERSGAYAADVKLSIMDTQGDRVLDLPAVGPVVLVNLPKGHYRVVASYEGKEILSLLSVSPQQTKTVHLAW